MGLKKFTGDAAVGDNSIAEFASEFHPRRIWLAESCQPKDEFLADVQSAQHFEWVA